MPDTKIHDSFCRCRTCKPPLPSRDEIELARLKVGLIVASIATAALLAWKAVA